MAKEIVKRLVAFEEDELDVRTVATGPIQCDFLVGGEYGETNVVLEVVLDEDSISCVRCNEHEGEDIEHDGGRANWIEEVGRFVLVSLIRDKHVDPWESNLNPISKEIKDALEEVAVKLAEFGVSW